MADLGDRTGDVNIWNDDRTKAVTVTTDGSKERLDVDANISGITATPGRVATPIHEVDGWDNDQTKISYTVPTGKILYVQRLWCAHVTDAGGHTISFRVGSTAFCYMNFNNDGTTSFEKTYPESNPYTLTAGQVLTAYRLEGSSTENWGAGFDGYLEDA